MSLRCRATMAAFFAAVFVTGPFVANAFGLSRTAWVAFSGAEETSVISPVTSELERTASADDASLGIEQIPQIFIDFFTSSARDTEMTAYQEVDLTEKEALNATITVIGIVSCPVTSFVGCALAVGSYVTTDVTTYFSGIAATNEALLNRQAGRSVATAFNILNNGSYGFCAGAPNTPAYYCCTYSVTGGEHCTCGGCGEPGPTSLGVTEPAQVTEVLGAGTTTAAPVRTEVSPPPTELAVEDPAQLLPEDLASQEPTPDAGGVHGNDLLPDPLAALAVISEATTIADGPAI